MKYSLLQKESLLLTLDSPKYPVSGNQLDNLPSQFLYLLNKAICIGVLSLSRSIIQIRRELQLEGCEEAATLSYSVPSLTPVAEVIDRAVLGKSQA